MRVSVCAYLMIHLINRFRFKFNVSSHFFGFFSEGERLGSISYVDSVVGMISDVVPAGVGPLTVGPLGTGTGSRKTHYRTQEMVNWVKMINTDGKVSNYGAKTRFRILRLNYCFLYPYICYLISYKKFYRSADYFESSMKIKFSFRQCALHCISSTL